MTTTDEVLIPDMLPRARRRRLLMVPWGLAVVIVIYVVLGSLYILNTPLLEGPGELFAMRYAVRFAQSGRLPEPASPDNWAGQADAHQPPLYYALGSLFGRRILPEALDTLQVNPYASLSPDTYGNKNVLIHPIADSPGSPLRSAMYWLRALSLVFGCAALVITWLIARLLAPQDSRLQLAAVMVAAFNPLFLVATTAAVNTALLILLLSAAVLIALRILRDQVADWRWYGGLGLVIGLASLTSTFGLLGWILILLVVAFSRRNDVSVRKKKHLAFGIAAWLLSLGIAGWWYIRNGLFYGDPLLLSLARSSSYPVGTFPAGDIISRLATYWGVFGWGNINAGRTYYALAAILGVLGMMGLLYALARRYWEGLSSAESPWQLWATALLWVISNSLVLLVAPYLVQPPIMALLMAMPLFALAIPLGLRAWLPGRGRKVLIWAMPLLLLIATLVSPWRYIIPAYEPVATLSLGQVPSNIKNLSLSYGDDMYLLGYELPSDHVSAGEAVTLRLYWMALRKMEYNASVSIRILGRDQMPIGGVDTYPDSGRLATTVLLPGDVVRDTYIMPIAPDSQAPVAAEIRVGLLNAAQQYLPIRNAAGQPLEEMPVVARVGVIGPQEPVLPQTSIEVNLGDKVQLIGYDLSATTLEPGGEWAITLYWRPLVPLVNDYTVFVHLLNEQGEKVAQVDEQPVGSNYPTSFWQVQDVIQDTHIITLPPDLPAGGYTLSIGMYLLSTGQRLPVVPSTPVATDIVIGPYYPQTR